MKKTAVFVCSVVGALALSAAAPDSAGKIKCEGVYKGHLQGVDVHGTNVWWSFTRKIVRTDLSGKTLASCTAPNHQGDLCVKGKDLYVAVNLGRFNTETGGRSFVFLYDAMSLRLKDIWKLDMPHGAGGITWKDDRFYVVGGLPRTHDRNYVYEYDTDFRLLKRHELVTGYTHLGIQTAAHVDGEFLFGIYGEKGSPGGVLRCSPDFSSVRRYVGQGSIGLAKVNGTLYVGATDKVRKDVRIWNGEIRPAADLLDDSKLYDGPGYRKGVCAVPVPGTSL